MASSGRGIIRFLPPGTAKMLEGYCTEDIELGAGDEVSILAQPDPLNVYIQNVSGIWLQFVVK